eukprot:jgi/Galph1/1610/GphlegSOOS_G294.1
MIAYRMRWCQDSLCFGNPSALQLVFSQYAKGDYCASQRACSRRKRWLAMQLPTLKSRPCIHADLYRKKLLNKEHWLNHSYKLAKNDLSPCYFTESSIRVENQQDQNISSWNMLHWNKFPCRRIAMVIEPSPFTHISGYSNRFIETLRYLKEAGDEVIIIVPEITRSAPKEIFGYPIFSIPGFRFPLYSKIVLSFGATFSLFSILKKFKPDLVHLATPGILCFSILLWVRLLRVPLLLSYHTHLPAYAIKYGLGALEELCWRLIRYVHVRADLTITVSPQICQQMEEKGIKHVQLWRKAVDCNRFHPKFRRMSKRELLTDGNLSSALIIYVGRLGVEKNLLCLKQLFSYIPNMRLAFIGDGPYASYLQSYYKDTPTVFTGMLTEMNLSEAFASADIFVMPSETETLGFVVLEAMASGVPVVATHSGGIPDLIQHNKTGLLYEPGDMKSCAMYIQQILDNPVLANQLATQARMEAEQWDWKTATAILRNVQYRRAILHFQNRRAYGISLPRMVSFYRWFRRKYALWKQQVLGRRRLWETFFVK